MHVLYNVVGMSHDARLYVVCERSRTGVTVGSQLGGGATNSFFPIRFYYLTDVNIAYIWVFLEPIPRPSQGPLYISTLDALLEKNTTSSKD